MAKIRLDPVVTTSESVECASESACPGIIFDRRLRENVVLGLDAEISLPALMRNREALLHSVCSKYPQVPAAKGMCLIPWNRQGKGRVQTTLKHESDRQIWLQREECMEI